MRLSRDEETRLIQTAQRGSEEAFHKLWETYEKALLGYIIPRLSQSQRTDPDIAHDIVQDTWLEVRKIIHYYSPDRGPFHNFVKRRANLVLLRHLSKRKRRLDIEMLLYEFPELREEEELRNIIEEMSDYDYSDLEIMILLEMYRALLEITFRDGGYPHQLIAFGYNKLIDDWGPQRIVDELSDELLESLEKKLEEGYILESMLPEDDVRGCFQPLRKKLKKKVDAVIMKTDSSSRKLLWKILSEFVGETMLQSYYGNRPEANIADWSNKVKVRIRTAIMKVHDLPF